MVKFIYHDVPWNSNLNDSNTFFTGFYNGNQNQTIQESNQKFSWSHDATELMKLDATGNLFVFNDIITSNVITTSVVSASGINTGNVIPNSNAQYSLGSINNRFKELFLTGDALYLDNTKITCDVIGNVYFGSTTDTLYRSVICDKFYVGDGSNLIAISKDSNGTGLAVTNPNDPQSNIIYYLAKDQSDILYGSSNIVTNLQESIQGFSNNFQSSNIVSSNISTYNLDAVTVSFVDAVEVTIMTSNILASNISEGGTPLTQKYVLSNTLLDTLSNYHTVTDFNSYSNWVDVNYAYSNTLSNFTLVTDFQTFSNLTSFQYAPSNTLSNYHLISDFQSYSNWANIEYAPSNTLSNYVLSHTLFDYSNWETTNYAFSNTQSNYTLLNTYITYSNWANSEYALKTVTVSPGSGLVGGGDLSSNVELALSNLGVSGTYGTSNKIPVITTDIQGRVSSVTEAPLYIGRVGLEHVVTLTSGNSYTPSVGVSKILAYVLGGGGGGGGCAASECSAGGGGGAGGLCLCFLSNIGAGPYTYNIGSGGTGGNLGNGADGGNTSITIEGTTYTGFGGSGGIYASTTGTFASGTGGSTSNSITPFYGESGTPGIGNYLLVLGGRGGSSSFGAGGDYMFYSSSGNNGKGYGAGGGGGGNDMTSNAQIGGNGAPGLIIIYEHV